MHLFEKNYYMIDFFSKNKISNLYDEPFEDGEIYNFNDVNYYVISISKLNLNLYVIKKKYKFRFNSIYN